MNQQMLQIFISYYSINLCNTQNFCKRNIICLEQNTSSFKYVGILFACTIKNIDMLSITDLIFNESAVFYKFKEGKSNFSRYEITTIIRQALGGNSTNYLKEYKVEKTFDGKNICYSTRVFKYRTIPSLNYS